MIDALKVLAIGDAHRDLQILSFRFKNNTFAELHNALGEVKNKTAATLERALYSIAEAQSCHWHRAGECTHADKRFEVNTHQIMAMKTRNIMDVQIIVSVLRVK